MKKYLKMYKYIYTFGPYDFEGTPAILVANTDEEAVKLFREKIGDYEIKSMEPFKFDLEKFEKLALQSGFYKSRD